MAAGQQVIAVQSLEVRSLNTRMVVLVKDMRELMRTVWKRWMGEHVQ